jgi:hypothetical protein
MATASLVNRQAPVYIDVPRQVKDHGGYKELEVSEIRKDIELGGSEQWGPATYANYLPVWDNEKGQK